MDWKDTLLPGASRTPYEQSRYPVAPVPDQSGYGFQLDTYGPPTWRNDWVMGPNGVPVISGSSEAQPGAGPQAMAGPSPGFMPVDPGVYGNTLFAGRGANVQDLWTELINAGDYNAPPGLTAPAGESWNAPQDSLDAFRKLILRKKAQGTNAPSLKVG